MPQLILGIHRNPEEVGSKASEGRQLSLQARASKQPSRFQIPSSMSLYRLPAEGSSFIQLLQGFRKEKQQGLHLVESLLGFRVAPMEVHFWVENALPPCVHCIDVSFPAVSSAVNQIISHCFTTSYNRAGMVI